MLYQHLNHLLVKVLNNLLIYIFGFQLGPTNDIIQKTVSHLAGELIEYLDRNSYYEELKDFLQACNIFG